MTKTKKIIISGLFAAILCFSGTNPAVAAISREELIAQIQIVQRQILILQIQLIQIRIADLQRQLEQMTANSRAFLDIIYPNGGEKLENHHCYNITWESRGIGRVSLGLDTPNGETVFASGVPASDGRYNWCAGGISGDDYWIRIFDPATSISDRSSRSFMVFDNSAGNRCSDGTIIGKCSTDKPKLCVDDELDLVDACHSCGCPSGQICGSNSKCR